MPTFDDPLADATEAFNALRGLAHATRTMPNPADTYPVIGDLLGGVRSLRQIVDQLATTHVTRRVQAFDDAGSHVAGERAARAAADELAQTVALLDQVESRLDQASGHSGRIAWQPAVVAPEPVRRWVGVVFLQGEAADEVLDLINRDGHDAAFTHLAQWDYGGETTQAALVNGYVYDEPPIGALDRAIAKDEYTLTYSPFLGHVSLLREYTAPPDPDLPQAVSESAEHAARRPASHLARPELSRIGWFARPLGAAPLSGRELSL